MRTIAILTLIALTTLIALSSPVLAQTAWEVIQARPYNPQAQIQAQQQRRQMGTQPGQLNYGVDLRPSTNQNPFHPVPARPPRTINQDITVRQAPRTCHQQDGNVYCW